MAIEAGHYEEARRALMADPVVQDMAEGVRWATVRADLAHADGTPRFEFMTAASREYFARGGTYSADRPLHIGAVAEAILRILDGGE